MVSQIGLCIGTRHNPAMRPLSPGSSERPAWLDRNPLALGAGFLLLYVALDWVSFIHPITGLNITPWNPQTAVAVALLAWRPRLWWLVWLAALAAALILYSLGALGAVVSATAFTLAYSATGHALARWLGNPPALRTRRQFLALLVIVFAGGLAASLFQLAALSVVDAVDPDQLLPAIRGGWIGYAVGLLVVLPLILLLVTRDLRRASRAMLKTTEWWLIVLAAVGGTVAVFEQPAEEFKYFYVLLVPVVWAAARFGLPGAVWSAVLVQLAVILLVQTATSPPLTVFELQMLVAALAATGLLQGTTVQEREEVDRKLRDSLRLAAAGDMAAALAHELNQPLGAMSNYARASKLLAERLGATDRNLGEPLADVAGKLVSEAARASETVKRLRNFFRDHATELELVDAPRWLEEVLQAQDAHARALDVSLSWSLDPALPALWLDRVQIAVVLRNLVGNAIDAAAETGPAPGAVPSVHVTATAAGGMVTIVVADSGGGLTEDEVLTVFENRRSTKPEGMGIGLGMCRSIVEAHGGTIWAEAGAGGKFAFTLPVGAGVSHA
jgi:two-component system, LuxR family, sensor kinase FixL